MKILVLILLILFFIAIIIYFNYNKKNKYVEKFSNDCEVGGGCKLENGFGNYDYLCNCIIYEEEEEEKIEDIRDEIEDIRDEIEDIRDEIEDNYVKDNPVKDNLVKDKYINCYKNNSNLDKICRTKNINYGIKNIIPCEEENYSEVVCGLNYINGVDYGDSIVTPCLNKTDDFDTWCRYYNNISKIPNGYNINSIGAKDILVGSLGACYTNDGKSDDSSARGICDYNHIEKVTRLEPTTDIIDYNIYTDCLPLNKTNFILNCNDLLKKNEILKNNTSIVTEIMGYDCNPGFGRAKCINSTDKYVVNNDFLTKSYDINDNNIIYNNSI